MSNRPAPGFGRGIKAAPKSSILQVRSEYPHHSSRSPKNKGIWWVLYSGFAEAAWNMAVDEWLMATAATRPPVLRLYGWSEPAISLGRHEPWRRVVDLERLRRSGVRLVRRPTGGRAVFHHRELTYSVSAARGRFEEFDQGLERVMEGISLALARGLGHLGIKAHFRRRHGAVPSKRSFCFEAVTRYELVCDARKVVGSAQYRSPQGFLQHGSIPAYATLSDLRFLSGRPRTFGDMAVAGPGWQNRSLDEAASAMVRGFCEVFGWRAVEMKLGSADLAAVAAFQRQRYSCPEWTFRR